MKIQVLKNMISIKHNKFKLLFFITLSFLLVGMACAGDVDSNTQQNTQLDSLADTTEIVSEYGMGNTPLVNDNVVYDNKVVKNNMTKESSEASDDKLNTEVYIAPIKDMEANDRLEAFGWLTDANRNRIKNATITLTFYGAEYNSTTNDYGIFVQRLYPQIPGKNTLTATYKGNDTYSSSCANISFNVSGLGPTNIHLDPINDTMLGERVTVHGRYTLNNNPVPLTKTNVRLVIYGKTYLTKTDDDGYFTYSFNATNPGTYPLTAYYPGNSRFEYSSSTLPFKVISPEPQETYITLDEVNDINYGERITISGNYYYGNNIPLTYTRMRFKINGQVFINTTDNRGHFTYTYTPENVFKNTVTVYYPGNADFGNAKNTTSFYVNVSSPIDSHIKLNECKDVLKGENITISGYYTYGKNTPLTYTNMRIRINNEIYLSKTDKNGFFTYVYRADKSGLNKVTVYYPGNANFNPASAQTAFNVQGDGPTYTYIKLNKIEDVTYGKYVNISGYYLYAGDIPLTNTPMKIRVNDKDFTAKTDDNGYFCLNYQSEKVFKNNVTVSYHGNNNFAAANASKTFNVNIETPIDTYIDLDEIREVKVGQRTRISGYYRYGNGMALSQASMFMHFNNDKWGVNVVTDADGYFYYDYLTVKNGTNKVFVSYPGNDNFHSALKRISFNVKS